LAEELEEAIYGEFKNTDNKYRNRVSIIFILENKKLILNFMLPIINKLLIFNY
jgi:hypothetical protein